MSLFLWKKSYEIGVAEIDMQHRKLVGMINELSDAMLEKRGYRAVPHILEELADYVKLHFSDEEKLMEKYNFPDAPRHLLAHEAFARKVVDFKEAYELEEDLDVRELLDFLCGWLKNHITVNDKAIARHIRRVKMGISEF